MNRRLFLGLVALSATGIIFPACIPQYKASPEKESLPTPSSQVFYMSSPAFEEGGRISIKYTCQGADVSLPLVWNEPPTETQSFTLIMEDLDGPNDIFTHWVIFNIPPDYRKLPEAIPNQSELSGGTLQGENDFGKIGYDGPCPPLDDMHKYQFTLYALAKPLDLSGGTSKKQVLDAMQGHILAQTQLRFTYLKICCTISLSPLKQ